MCFNLKSQRNYIWTCFEQTKNVMSSQIDALIFVQIRILVTNNLSIYGKLILFLVSAWLQVNRISISQFLQ